MTEEQRAADRRKQAKYRASEKGKATTRQYAVKYRATEKGKAAYDKYQESPEGRAASIRRTQRRRGFEGPGLTAEQWKQIKAGFSECCAYCCKPCDKLVQEHVVPLELDGPNDFTNIVPACHGCNVRKGKDLVKLGAYAK
jgi:hypothetical protein